MNDQVTFFRLITVIQAIQFHLKTNGQMRLTRIATPALMRSSATEFTGVTYPRSTKGLQKALADLLAIKEGVLSQREAEQING